MRVVLDLECNRLKNPDKIWCIVCKDIDTGEMHVFYERMGFRNFASNVSLWIGHNFLGFDYPVLTSLGYLDDIDVSTNVVDTLIISKLVDFPREKHSIEDYGLEFQFPKGTYSDWSKYSSEMEEYCKRDVEICHKIFLKYIKVIEDKKWKDAIALENRFQLVCNLLNKNGFYFNVDKAEVLLSKVQTKLEELDKDILEAFPPTQEFIRKVRRNKDGSINRVDCRYFDLPDIYTVEDEGIYRRKVFNPSSHKQLIDILSAAGWNPTDRTKTHVDWLRDRKKTLDKEKKIHYDKYGWKINEQNLSSLPQSAPKPARLLAQRILYESRRRTLTEWLNLVCLEIKINKENVGIDGIERSLIPIQYGEPDFEKENVDGETKSLWKNGKKQGEEDTSNILTDSLSKNLIKWLQTNKVAASFVKENQNFVWITVIGLEQLEAFYAALATWPWVGTKQEKMKFEIISSRIFGEFQGLGAWTGRMSHQRPNTANIPNELDDQGRIKLLGGDLRQLWGAPKGRLLVGCDAEGIQLRIFAHYIDDPEFTKEVSDGDPHSLNKAIMGEVCKHRQAAKRFIYALLLGAGMQKLGEILEASPEETKYALNRIMERYTGFKYLKEHVFPRDIRRGWFIGLDGRKVLIPKVSERPHLVCSGYLQAGEALIIKKATLLTIDKLLANKTDAILVDIVHDEIQWETTNNVDIALSIAKHTADSIKEAGEQYNLKCPMSGSYWSKKYKDYTIGTNWLKTH